MTHLDESILQFINHAGEWPSLDFVFVAFTVMGMLAVTLLAAPLIWARGKKDQAFDLVVSVLIVSLVVEILKVIVSRDRPFVALDGTVHTISYYGLAEASGPSFPSGHAARIFAAATTAVIGVRLPGKIVGFSLASMVALSRVYLGLHWPSDILAGAVLGVVFALIIALLGKRWEPYISARKRVVGGLARVLARGRSR